MPTPTEAVKMPEKVFFVILWSIWRFSLIELFFSRLLERGETHHNNTSQAQEDEGPGEYCKPEGLFSQPCFLPHLSFNLSLIFIPTFFFADLPISHSFMVFPRLHIRWLFILILMIKWLGPSCILEIFLPGRFASLEVGNQSWNQQTGKILQSKAHPNDKSCQMRLLPQRTLDQKQQFLHTCKDILHLHLFFCMEVGQITNIADPVQYYYDYWSIMILHLYL